MTNVLIPTDFTIASLKLAEQAVKRLNRPVNIILFHAFEMPFYYQDMVRPGNPVYHDLLTDQLRQASKQLKAQYPQLINKISVRCMQGSTNALFSNFLEANDIDMIICPSHYAYTKIHTQSLNPIPFFRKSQLPLLQDLGAVQCNVLARETANKMAGYSAAN